MGICTCFSYHNETQQSIDSCSVRLEHHSRSGSGRQKTPYYLDQNKWCMSQYSVKRQTSNTEGCQSQISNVKQDLDHQTSIQRMGDSVSDDTLTKDDKIHIQHMRSQMYLQTSSSHPLLSDYLFIEGTENRAESIWMLINDKDTISSGDVVLVGNLQFIVSKINNVNTGRNLTVCYQAKKELLVCGNSLEKRMANDYWRIDLFSQEQELKDFELCQFINIQTKKYLAFKNSAYKLNTKTSVSTIFQVKVVN